MVTGLMVTRNEAHFLKYSLPMLLQLCSKVIVLDASTDGTTREYLSQFPEVTVYFEEHYRRMNCQQRRQFLLNRGRETGEKYYITIDADEIITEELRVVLQLMLPYLADCKGFSCNWWHIIDDMHQRLWYDDFQGIAFYDDGTNYSRNVNVHEDKLPYGWPAKHTGFYHLDATLVHFGMCNEEYPEVKVAYYKYLEYLDGCPAPFTSDHNIPRHEHNEFWVKYPPHVTEDILKIDGKPNDYMQKIIEVAKRDIEPLYKLDIWYVDGLLDACVKNVRGFSKKKILYKSWRYPRLVIKIHKFIRKLLHYRSTGEYGEMWYLIRRVFSIPFLHIGYKLQNR